VTRRTDAFPDLQHNGCTGIDQKHKHGDKEMTNQMTSDKTAELSSQALTHDELEFVTGGTLFRDGVSVGGTRFSWFGGKGWEKNDGRGQNGEGVAVTESCSTGIPSKENQFIGTTHTLVHN